MSWSPAALPDLAGRLYVVTGASSGLGAALAGQLAGRGAALILAVRNEARGQRVAEQIRRRRAAADLVVDQLDLADLDSVRRFALSLVERGVAVDALVNNAGLGLVPRRSLTRDGFERQFGTNHLGHFALTGLLMPALMRAARPRVVTVSSIAHRNARIDFADLQGERRYSPGQAYARSKLANLLFAFELDRRAKAANVGLDSIAAHPGVARTGFIAATGLPAYQVAVGQLAFRLIGQSAEAGASPIAYAAAMPDVRGGQYWGPSGFREMRGDPGPAKPAAVASDADAARRLWDVSEALTGVSYPF